MFKKVHVCIIYLVDGNDKLVHTKSRLVCDRVIFHIRLYVDVQWIIIGLVCWLYL